MRCVGVSRSLGRARTDLAGGEGRASHRSHPPADFLRIHLGRKRIRPFTHSPRPTKSEVGGGR